MVMITGRVVLVVMFVMGAVIESRMITAAFAHNNPRVIVVWMQV
jgi:hypothetical protein